ncbi:MAG: glucose 1-dehydrogenase [Leucobacter sp.]|nr:glucose 1-dehydrogenase [Leucobacter sp.]
MSKAGRLHGRRAVVTGAGSGIGAAIARGYAAAGAHVLVADLNLDTAQGLVAEITAAEGVALAHQVDVSQQDSVDALFTYADEQLGGVDVLVNAAGVLRRQPFLDTDEESWDLVLRVNSLGPLLCTQAAAKRFIAQGDETRGAGKIVNICSTSSRQPTGDFTAYAASKAALLSLTQSTAKGLAPHGITVNGIGPGIVDTPLWRADALTLQDRTLEDYAAKIPLGRVSLPEDLVPTAVFLACEDSDYMTGQLLMVDGGMVMV